MSLTRELNKKQSSFRQLVEGCAPALAIAGGRSPEGKRIAERLGFYDLVKARSPAPLPDGVTDARRHSPTVGMAFDIRTRMMLGQFEPRRSASAMGMDVFNHLLAPLLPNGQHISDVLGDAFLEAERLTRDGDDVDQDYASIVFTWCESLYRAGGRAIRSSLGERLSAARNVDEVYDSIPPLMLEDIARLRIVNQRQIKHWHLRMRHGALPILLRRLLSRRRRRRLVHRQHPLRLQGQGHHHSAVGAESPHAAPGLPHPRSRQRLPGRAHRHLVTTTGDSQNLGHRRDSW